MEQDKKVLVDSEYSQSRVPKDKFQGFWQLFFVMVGFTFFSPSMITGGKLGLGLNLRDFILAVVIGNAFLAIYTGVLAYISQKSGLNLDLLANQAFGKKGSFISSALVSFTQTGWFGVGVAMFAIPVSKIYGVNTYFLVLVSGFLMTVTAVVGIKALSIFGTVAVPLIAILGSYSSFLSLDKVAGFQNIFSESPTQELLLTAAIAMVIANFISGGTSTPNFTRFAKSSTQAVWVTVIAFFFGNILMISFGAIGASVYNEADIFNVLTIQGLTVPAILTLGLNIWSTNNNALYTAGLGVSNLSKLPIKLSTFIMGTIGTLAAIYLYDNFTGYLTILGTIIPPIGGVIIMYYFLHKEQLETGPEIPQENMHWPSILAVAISVVISFVMPFGIEAINGLLSSIIVYLVLELIYEKILYKS